MTGENGMKQVVGGGIVLLALFYIVVGIRFLVDPLGAGALFNVGPAGQIPGGMAVMRGDFTSFFVVGGGVMLLGLWKKNPLLLTISAATFGIPLCARAISLVVDGNYPGAVVPPMVVEALTVALVLSAARMFSAKA